MVHSKPARQTPPFHSTSLALGNMKLPAVCSLGKEGTMLTSSSGKGSYGSVWAEPEVSMKQSSADIGRENKGTEDSASHLEEAGSLSLS